MMTSSTYDLSLDVLGPMMPVLQVWAIGLAVGLLVSSSKCITALKVVYWLLWAVYTRCLQN
jgi:hypothetical protein